jgi:uncharacterized alpha/beta hydrolase family protein
MTKVHLASTIVGEDGEHRTVFVAPKRKSIKDIEIERLTKDLEQTKRSLNTIFDTLANEAMPYPERVGYCKGNAAWALYVIGGARQEIAEEVARIMSDSEGGL